MNNDVLFQKNILCRYREQKYSILQFHFYSLAYFLTALKRPLGMLYLIYFIHHFNDVATDNFLCTAETEMG